MDKIEIDLATLTEIQVLVTNFNKYYEIGPNIIKLDLGREVSEIEISTEKEVRMFNLFGLKLAKEFVENYIRWDSEYQGYLASQYDDSEEEGWKDV